MCEAAMTKVFGKVHLIVAPDYGERLRSLPMDEPAWIADTPANKPFIEQMRQQKRPAITSFRVDEKTNPSAWLVSILDEL